MSLMDTLRHWHEQLRLRAIEAEIDHLRWEIEHLSDEVERLIVERGRLATNRQDPVRTP